MRNFFRLNKKRVIAAAGRLKRREGRRVQYSSLCRRVTGRNRRQLCCVSSLLTAEPKWQMLAGIADSTASLKVRRVPRASDSSAHHRPPPRHLGEVITITSTNFNTADLELIPSPHYLHHQIILAKHRTCDSVAPVSSLPAARNRLRQRSHTVDNLLPADPAQLNSPALTLVHSRPIKSPLTSTRTARTGEPQTRQRARSESSTTRSLLRALQALQGRWGYNPTPSAFIAGG
jgi:hypothetical protein